MVTNTSEYQKEYQREYRKSHPQKQYKKSKEVKKISKEVKKEDPMITIAKARLHKPREVETSGSEYKMTSVADDMRGQGSPDDSKASEMDKLDPEYRKWCLSNETQRHYYYTKFGKTHRKDQRAVKRDLKNRGNEIKMVELMKTNKKALYADCMRELKEVLRKRNER